MMETLIRGSRRTAENFSPRAACAHGEEPEFLPARAVTWRGQHEADTRGRVAARLALAYVRRLDATRAGKAIESSRGRADACKPDGRVPTPAPRQLTASHPPPPPLPSPPGERDASSYHPQSKSTRTPQNGIGAAKQCNEMQDEHGLGIREMEWN